MVLEEQPAKLSEAFRLFLQGQGFGMKVFSLIYVHLVLLSSFLV